MSKNIFKKCRDCIYYERELDANDIGKNSGVCRRYPPTVTPIPVQTQGGMGIQPFVLLPPVDADNNGCGEHKNQLTLELTN